MQVLNLSDRAKLQCCFASRRLPSLFPAKISMFSETVSNQLLLSCFVLFYSFVLFVVVVVVFNSWETRQLLI